MVISESNEMNKKTSSLWIVVMSQTAVRINPRRLLARGDPRRLLARSPLPIKVVLIIFLCKQDLHVSHN